MNDTELERRVRTTLRAVAEATPVDSTVAAWERAPRRRSLASMVAVAAAVAGLVGAAAALAAADRDEKTTKVDSANAPFAAGALPMNFEPTLAAPIFTAPGSVDEVAEAYMRARFPDYPAPGIVVEPASQGEVRVVRWSTSTGDEGPIAAGGLQLRSVDGRWAVVAATTDSIDLAGLSYQGDRVRGVVRSASDQTVSIEVLDWKQERVRHAQEAIVARGDVAIDVPNRLAPTTVRVTLVGGTVLAVAEVRLEPPAVPPHRDFDGCIAKHTTMEKEPTPDIVGRLCAAALDGVVLGRGAASDPSWELVASDEPTGHWVTLRWRDLVGTFRIQTDPPAKAAFAQLGACCGLADNVAVVGALRAGSTGMQVVLGDGTAIAADGITDPATGVVYAVALVPASSTGPNPTARVAVRDGHGRFTDTGLDVNLRILGG
jgi:hypothetical protein